MSRIAKIALVCLLWAACACGASIQSAAKEVTKGAAPAAVTGGLQALDEPATRARIAELMASPEVQKAVRDLAGAATAGATKALTDSQLAKRTAELADGIATLATRAAVDAALEQATSPVNQRRIEQIAAAAADSAVRNSMRALADELPRTMGPALATAVRSDLAPSLQALVGPELRNVIAQTAYEVARQAVLGSNAGLAELEQRQTKTGTLARMTGWLSHGGWYLAAAIGMVFALFTAIVILFRRTRQIRGRSETVSP